MKSLFKSALLSSKYLQIADGRAAKKPVPDGSRQCSPSKIDSE